MFHEPCALARIITFILFKKRKFRENVGIVMDIVFGERKPIRMLFCRFPAKKKPCVFVLIYLEIQKRCFLCFVRW